MAKVSREAARALMDGAQAQVDRRSGEPAMIDALVGRSVRQLRELRGLSRNALGAACGVTGQQIDKYERGTNRISLSRFAQIADALGTDPISLLGQAEQLGEPRLPASPRTAERSGASHRIKAAEMMRLALDMDEALLDHLLALAKAARR